MNPATQIQGLRNQYRRTRDEFLKHLTIEFRKATRPKVVEISGVKIPVPSDIGEGPLRAIYGNYYEKAELRIVQVMLNHSDRVMELGTGLGFLSCYCAQKIGSDRVFTYEANPQLEPSIRELYRLNGVSPNLHICLLGEEPGERVFYVSKNFDASSLIQRSSNDKPINVIVKAFNEEIRTINPTCLIIDIEGGEYELFQYANLNQVSKIVMEQHERMIGADKAEFVRAKLMQMGFQINPALSGKTVLYLERSTQ